MTRPAFLLAGPTASGKSAAAELLARDLGAALLSADSMLVYRGMDIGTAKPSAAVRAALGYGGLDLVDPSGEFSSGAWLRAAAAFVRTLPPGKPLIVVGGTGLYFTALVAGLDRPALDPVALAAANALIAEKGTAAALDELRRRDSAAASALRDPGNPRRLAAALARPAAPPPATRRVLPSYPVLDVPRDILKARIAARLDAMFAAGWVDEVRRLRAAFPVLSKTAAAAIGYAEIGAALAAGTDPAAEKPRILARTLRLAKHQATWFRHQAVPLSVPASPDPAATATAVLETWRKHGPQQIILPED